MADDRGRLFARPDAPHRVHDLLLVAAYAAGDATGPDRELAEALVGGCDQCAGLVIDLQAVQAAVTTAPTPPRRRDFRLTRADAERLKPHGVRGLVAAFTHPRLERAHPIAAGLTMLGLTGVLISGLSLGWAGGASTPTAGDSPGVFQIELASGAPEAAATEPPDISDTGIVGGAPPPSQAAVPAASQGAAPAASQAAAAASQAAAAASPAARTGAADGRQVGGPASDPSRLVIAIGSAIVAIAGLTIWVLALRRRRRYG